MVVGLNVQRWMSAPLTCACRRTERCQQSRRVLMTAEFTSSPAFSHRAGRLPNLVEVGAATKVYPSEVDDSLFPPLGVTSLADTLAPLSLERPSVLRRELLGGRTKHDDALAELGVHPHSSARFQVLVTFVADLVSLIVAVFVGLSVLSLLSGAHANSLADIGGNLLDQGVLLVVTLASFAVYGFYRQRRRRFRPGSFAGQVSLLHAVALGVLSTLGIGVVIHRLFGRPEMPPAQLISVAGAAPHHRAHRTGPRPSLVPHLPSRPGARSDRRERSHGRADPRSLHR